MNLIQDHLTVNPFSRPGYKLPIVKGIIMHWVANPMTSAKANRDFFENRKDGKSGYGSAHYIVGLSGEVIQCIPDSEVAYHVGTDRKDPESNRIYTNWCRGMAGKSVPNWCFLGIEMTHLDWEGSFAEVTLGASAELVAKLLKKHSLPNTDYIGTHQMVVGWKDCPRLWVKRPELFQAWKKEVKEWM
jgi:N-acetylmuramoyl-L-alanine amidase